MILRLGRWAHSLPCARALGVALATMLLSLPSAAQRPIVLVHGLASDGTSWADAASRISTTYGAAVSVSTPSLPSLDYFEVQADALDNTTAGLPATDIVVGHSNGGLVARTSSLFGHQWSGIMTVGTLHAGAPLAANVLNGALFEEAQYLTYTISAPFWTYSQYFPDDIWWQIAYAFGWGAWNVGEALPSIGRAIGFGANYTVLSEMVPGSEFLTGRINSEANLLREAAAVPQRIGIQVATGTDFGLPWQAAGLSNWQDVTLAVYGTAVIFYYVGDYYTFYDDYSDPWWYEKQADAYLWYAAGDALFGLDQNWCSLVGSVDAAYECLPSDAVVPFASQAYPGATHGYAVIGPAHVKETSDPTVEGQIVTSLTNDFGVHPPPSTPLNVSVTGPSTVWGCSSATWTAAATGGRAPYTYSWHAETSTISTGQSPSLTYTNTGTTKSMTVATTVMDATGARASSTPFAVAVRLPCPY